MSHRGGLAEDGEEAGLLNSLWTIHLLLRCQRLIMHSELTSVLYWGHPVVLIFESNSSSHSQKLQLLNKVQIKYTSECPNCILPNVV